MRFYGEAETQMLQKKFRSFDRKFRMTKGKFNRTAIKITTYLNEAHLIIQTL
jgi:hypothetical protein